MPHTLRADGLEAAFNSGTRRRNRKKPGPKPGSRHSGMFTKNDPRINREGPHINPMKRTLEQLCQEHVEDAVQFLVDTLNDDQASTKDKALAARELLDRGFGKPVDRQAVITMTGGGGQDTSLDINKMSNTDLEKIVSGAVLDMEPIHSLAHDSHVVDLQPVNGSSSSPFGGRDD